jgi:hypothetical protein
MCVCMYVFVCVYGVHVFVYGLAACHLVVQGCYEEQPTRRSGRRVEGFESCSGFVSTRWRYLRDKWLQGKNFRTCHLELAFMELESLPQTRQSAHGVAVKARTVRASVRENKPTGPHVEVVTRRNKAIITISGGRPSASADWPD